MRATFLIILLGGVAAAAPSPSFNGRWRTDLSSLTFSSKPEMVMLKNRQYACITCLPTYTVPADGAFHRVAGEPAVDERKIEIVDERTMRITDRQASRVTRRVETTVSSDDRTRIIASSDFYQDSKTDFSFKILQRRVGAAEMGAHRVSGSWLSVAMLSASDASRTEQLILRDGFLEMSRATGESYRAQLNGAPAPYIGDPSITAVAVKNAGTHELIEQHFYNGRLKSTLTLRLSLDGKQLVLRQVNERTGSTSFATATKL